MSNEMKILQKEYYDVLEKTQKGDGDITAWLLWFLDCFSGSGTTGIASNLFNRKYVGIEKEKKSLELSKARRLEINNETIRKSYISRVLEAIATDADWKDVVSEMSKYKIEAYSKKSRIQKYSRDYFQENKEAIYERRKAKGKPSNQNAIWASEEDLRQFRDNPSYSEDTHRLASQLLTALTPKVYDFTPGIGIPWRKPTFRSLVLQLADKAVENGYVLLPKDHGNTLVKDCR